MSIVNQYKPEAPRAKNALQRLSIMRQQARIDADEAYKELCQEVHDTLNPEVSTGGMLFSIFNHIPMILKGVAIGRKLVGRLRGLFNREE